MRDYYEILNVDKNSSENDIKKAYRKVAMKYHPDKNQNNKEAEDKFKEAAEAYSILSDENKKARYDQFGHAGVNDGFGGGGSSGFSNMDVNDIFGSFSDIFGGGDIFGRSGSRRKSYDGGDLKITIDLTLEEILSGTAKTIKIKRWEKTNKEPIKCSKCSGTGEMRFVQRSFLGQVVNVKPCSTCSGVGYIGGREQKTAKIKIDIPIGVSEGNYMTLEGEGDRSMKDGRNGDLVVYFREISHELFFRSNNDIYIDCWIDYPDAVMGTEIKVPTLNGFVKMKVPEGINNGQLLRLKNKGIAELNRHKSGDQYIRVNINTPTKVNNKIKSILEELKLNLDSDAKFKRFNNV